MRFLGVDAGARRFGLAISDTSATLARGLTSVRVESVLAGVDPVADMARRLAVEDDGLDGIVVGLPRRLDGTPTEMTAAVTAFVEALRGRQAVPVTTVDERLTSHEADARLARRERDWRARKAQLDAEAAAVLLQDFLDARARTAPATEPA